MEYEIEEIEVNGKEYEMEVYFNVSSDASAYHSTEVNFIDVEVEVGNVLSVYEIVNFPEMKRRIQVKPVHFEMAQSKINECEQLKYHMIESYIEFHEGV